MTIKRKLQQFYRSIKPKTFQITDNGQDNTFEINPNKVIGNSIITIRKGSHNRVNIGNGGKFNNLKIDINGNHNTITIGDRVKFSGHLLVVGDGLHIQIGDETTAIGCYVLARDKSVEIGERCMISRDVEIRATDVHKVYDLETGKRLNTATSDIKIGHHVWIAAGVTISKNVEIASDCIIAKGSFVNKSISTSNALIGGMPATVLRTGIRWER